ncbi:dihydrolipoyllysine-residue succinyltransferase component of 2-oxoglutarate dehydrogenase complex [Methylococcus mesophilus]|uniref:hypothetical protein n=1 Tax=Methylococcus mesophilus TaxID=2993564 RepID=UPI00224B1781|nr:hypothetical protein [Methylococcus mesophilus]UZR29061.1 hypothetical protein OOT43_00110 [Methylococcus mesophilus]
MKAEQLIKERKAGRDKVYSMLKELRQAGYAVLRKKADGRTDWLIFDGPQNESDQPDPENPDQGFEPHPEKPDPENPDREFPDDKEINTETATKTERDNKDSLKETPTPKPRSLPQREKRTDPSERKLTTREKGTNQRAKSTNPRAGGSPPKPDPYDPRTEPIPDCIPPQAWADYCQHRQDLKAPLTPMASKRAIKLLTEAHEAGQSPEAIIDKSILSGWQGLFPDKNPPQRRRNPDGSHHQDNWRDRVCAGIDWPDLPAF